MSNDNGKALVAMNRGATEIQIYSKEKIELIKRTIARGATDDELALFVEVCNRRQLDPFKRQIYAIKRWNPDTGGQEMAIQTGIDGLRVLAERTGKYAGQIGPFWCSEDGTWVDVWLSSKPPVAAKVGVYKTGWKEPVWGIAKYSEFVQRKKGGEPNAMWAKMPDNQLAKCAEGQALRKAFPEDVAGIEIAEEGEGIPDHIIDAQPPEPQISRKDERDLDEAFGVEIPARQETPATVIIEQRPQAQKAEQPQKAEPQQKRNPALAKYWTALDKLVQDANTVGLRGFPLPADTATKDDILEIGRTLQTQLRDRVHELVILARRRGETSLGEKGDAIIAERKWGEFWTEPLPGRPEPEPVTNVDPETGEIAEDVPPPDEAPADPNEPEEIA